MSKTRLLFVSYLISIATLAWGKNCGESGWYTADPYQCDAYTECKDGVEERKLCPEGLMFNDKSTEYPRYPCSYPQEVDCGRRTKTQAAQGTAECPHSYGMFRSGGGAKGCGSFKNCVGGVAYRHECPEGLAFNEEKLRCDWPDEVPGCDAASFLRFSCPGFRVDADFGHPRYSDPGDCRKFWVCVENTKPRMNSCSIGYVFNPQLGVCDQPKNVPNCANYYPANVLQAIETLRNYDNSLFDLK